MGSTGDKAETSKNGSVPEREPARIEFDELIARLSARRQAFTRYQVLGEIGRGGMGRVMRVHDVDLHRELAMKVLRVGDVPATEPASNSSSLQLHARFLEEAQVAGQLDHPGIVPVHDVGLDAEGRIYFTMKLVRGRTLHDVLELAADGADGWSLTRVLGVLLRVCESMGYAHDRGVLHRDLKPGNIMVGHHGEVYVMDWGLARLLDRPDPRAGLAHHTSEDLHSARRGSPESGTFMPFVTEAGRVLGTPAYMSPEQAEGDSRQVGPGSDVYGVGAILYEALTGAAPYTKRGERVNNRAVWDALLQGPPKPVSELARDAPPEVIAICEKAMERDVARRYRSMTELAEDLRAYLELRVVRAHRTGPVTELKKWIARNRATAILLSALVVVVASAGFVGAWRERVRARGLALRADAHTAATIVARLDELWPIAPDAAPRMKAWLAEARASLAGSDLRARELAEFESDGTRRGTAHTVSVARDLFLEEEIEKAERLASDMRKLLAVEYSDQNQPLVAGEAFESWLSGRSVLPTEVDWWAAHAEALKERRAPKSILRFDDSTDEEAHSTLLSLLRDHEQIRRETAAIEARAELASTLKQRTIDSEADAWERAIRSIGDPGQCPLYGGLSIAPQVGLVPLRRDAGSGLWEFWHVSSGERPSVKSDGRYEIGSDTGIVLVLVPGGEALAGAAKDPSAKRHDPAAKPTERLRSARLDSFFLSKYEVTQGQWFHMTGQVPSLWYPGIDMIDSPRVTRSNPVESVDWHAAMQLLGRCGLMLPTEMQWEWAARGNTTLPYGDTADFELVRQKISFGDDAFLHWTKGASVQSVGRDGSRIHLPVDSFDPNPFGLYCAIGNVSEWCLDAYADSNDRFDPQGKNGEVSTGRLGARVVRGGSFRDGALWLRLSARNSVRPTEKLDDLGLRPARAVDP